MQLVCYSENCEANECVELTEREALVCDLICQSQHPISFNDLKRRTSLHQEILSRIVYRLIVHRVVEKEDGGYKSKCGQ